MAVWLITGCSSGFGKEIARAALKHGDKVIATSRNTSSLSDLKILGAATIILNVNGTATERNTSVCEAAKIYGTIDVLVNNAAYVLITGTEEAMYDHILPSCSKLIVYSDAEVRAQFDTNFFGPASIIRSVLPFMRAQKSGVIANIGSLGGYASNAGSGYYCATKFAIAGMTEALRAEVAPLNIKATAIEPGYFRTGFLNSEVGGKIIAAKSIEDIRSTMEPVKAMID